MLVPDQIANKTILFSCLDWGFGHISRSVELIIRLQNQGNTIVFVGNQSAHDILCRYGFQGQWIETHRDTFQFNGSGNFYQEAFRNSLRFLKAKKSDKQLVEQISERQNIDLILSDHRYGFLHRTIPSIFITHQCNLPIGTPKIAQFFHWLWMSRFHSIWIMDVEKDALAGELSKKVKNSVYIGWFSRFQHTKTSQSTERITCVAIVSGPAPYARQFLELILDIAGRNQFEITIVTSLQVKELPVHVHLISDWVLADECIRNADFVVSRNGYSTLMDLKTLFKTAILLPTNGQLEQLYLAQINSNPKWFIAKNDDDLERLILKGFKKEL